jgi:hypothetical protein
MIPTVASQRAEDAASLIMRTVGAHRTHLAAMAVPPRARLSTPRHNPHQVAHQATLIRLASITEAYCAGALIAATEALAQPSRTQTMQQMWDEMAISATRTWKDQQAAYKNWVGVTIKWDTVDGLADARNAIAHGLGSLTRQQVLKEAAVRGRLVKVGITLVGRDLELSDTSLHGLALRCRDFILDLDVRIQARLASP